MNDALERVILVDAARPRARHGAKLDAHGAASCIAPSRSSSTTAPGSAAAEAPRRQVSFGRLVDQCLLRTSAPRRGDARAASRRLEEEMGFTCPLSPLGSLIYRADVGGGLIEHELVHLFAGVWRGSTRATRGRSRDARLVAALFGASDRSGEPRSVHGVVPHLYPKSSAIRASPPPVMIRYRARRNYWLGSARRATARSHR